MCSSCETNVQRGVYEDLGFDDIYDKSETPTTAVEEATIVDETSYPKRPLGFDVDEKVAEYRSKLEDIEIMVETIPKMGSKGQSFAKSLHSQFVERGWLSDRQWPYVTRLVDQVEKTKPIYGSFNAILVMFNMAACNDKVGNMKYPKIRLITKEGQYVRLSFNPERNDKRINVHIGGWKGGGRRLFAGWIEDDKIIPYDIDRMTDDIQMVIQELALDPQRVAKAMAALLGVCMYCERPLTDPRSKENGYGARCAERWGLEY